MPGCMNRGHTLKGHPEHKSRKSQLSCLVAAIDGVPFGVAYRAVSDSWGMYFKQNGAAGWLRLADGVVLPFNNDRKILRHRQTPRSSGAGR
jgi:hypothetical protein